MRRLRMAATKIIKCERHTIKVKAKSILCGMVKIIWTSPTVFGHELRAQSVVKSRLHDLYATGTLQMSAHFGTKHSFHTVRAC
jgi:hypothetical protein